VSTRIVLFKFTGNVFTLNRLYMIAAALTKTSCDFLR
jgi:hypothetical protein